MRKQKYLSDQENIHTFKLGDKDGCVYSVNICLSKGLLKLLGRSKREKLVQDYTGTIQVQCVKGSQNETLNKKNKRKNL